MSRDYQILSVTGGILSQPKQGKKLKGLWICIHYRQNSVRCGSAKAGFNCTHPHWGVSFPLIVLCGFCLLWRSCFQRIGKGNLSIKRLEKKRFSDASIGSHLAKESEQEKRQTNKKRNVDERSFLFRAVREDEKSEKEKRKSSFALDGRQIWLEEKKICERHYRREANR